MQDLVSVRLGRAVLLIWNLIHKLRPLFSGLAHWLIRGNMGGVSGLACQQWRLLVLSKQSFMNQSIQIIYELFYLYIVLTTIEIRSTNLSYFETLSHSVEEEEALSSDLLSPHQYDPNGDSGPFGTLNNTSGKVFSACAYSNYPLFQNRNVNVNNLRLGQAQHL